MITEKELHEAIAECQGVRNPDAKTCLKLASFYTILDHVAEKTDPDPKPQVYSYASGRYRSQTEFGELIADMDEYSVFEIMDELMSTLSVVNPRLYASVIRKLRGEA